MHFHLLRISIAVILILGLSGKAVSQNTYKFHENWSIEPNFGYSKFYGDIKDKKTQFVYNTPFHKYFWQDRKLMYGVMISKEISPIFSLRGQILGGKVTGTHESKFMHFKSNILEFNLNLKIDISDLILGNDDSRKSNFYFFTGVGLTNWDTHLYDSKTGKIISGTGFLDNVFGKRFSATEGVIPIGIGYDYSLNDNWKFTFETSIHGINTDKLDAYISNKPKTEGYAYTGFGLAYKFESLKIRFSSRNLIYNRKAKDPAIREYNKNKKVVMTSPQQKKAMKKRYDPKKGFRQSWFEKTFSKRKFRHKKNNSS